MQDRTILRCDGCGVEITWSPVVVPALQGVKGARPAYYCCRDCQAGTRCDCGWRMEMDEESSTRQRLPGVD
jgi:hypothetical protein